MTIGKPYALVNGNQVGLDSSIGSKLGRVMIPLRFVGEQLGLQVNWDQKAYTISLLTGGDIGLSGDSEEMRAAWVSTVFNLDWPSAVHMEIR